MSAVRERLCEIRDAANTLTEAAVALGRAYSASEGLDVGSRAALLKEVESARSHALRARRYLIEHLRQRTKPSGETVA